MNPPRFANLALGAYILAAITFAVESLATENPKTFAHFEAAQDQSPENQAKRNLAALLQHTPSDL